MEENLPLVSILIPAYNQVHYLEKALISVLSQTYTNIEIIICDDSTNNKVEKLIKNYIQHNKNIKYYNNGGPLGEKGALNMQRCFDVSRGEYINYLMHDDLFFPNKIKSMLKYLISNEDVTLVTSHKRFINENGEFFDDTKPLLDKNCKINGENLGLYVLNSMTNVIGEPTTVMFRKKDIDDKILDYKGWSARGFGDIAIWLKLLSKGHAVYIREPLSCFRLHYEQNTYDPIIELWGVIDWYYFTTNSYLNKSFIKTKKQYLIILEKWFNKYISKIKLAQNYSKSEDEDLYKVKKDLYCCYNEAIKTLLKL
ncbi:glycosyltransferase [Clostridium sp. DJ247]|uniref:glycosyltransferase family 2 protein n=1 Tax=Clostridium sp. DJ247 TaxID=2726188 RepID=UPI001627A2EB|nr:glycosyltransferase [Clostridium sp. DJ247]MBC2580269.1 glycosyltransferase [Clostridium sp. DJ247]